MAASSGITDEAVLDRLIDEGLTPASIAAVALAPLVAVAWADRKLEEKERKVVLEEAEKSGIRAGAAEYDLLSRTWLLTPPPPSLLAAWREYAQALAGSMGPGRAARTAGDAARAGEGGRVGRGWGLRGHRLEGLRYRRGSAPGRSRRRWRADPAVSVELARGLFERPLLGFVHGLVVRDRGHVLLHA